MFKRMFGGLLSPKSGKLSLEEIQQLLLIFIETDNWEDRKRILEQYQTVLLSSEVNTMLRHMLQQAQEYNDFQAEVLFTEHLALLERCRQMDIEQAFAEIRQLPNLGAILQVLDSLPSNLQEMPRRGELCRQDGIDKNLVNPVNTVQKILTT